MKRQIIAWATLSWLPWLPTAKVSFSLTIVFQALPKPESCSRMDREPERGWTAQLYAGPRAAPEGCDSHRPRFARRVRGDGLRRTVEIAIPGVAAGARATIVMRAYNGASFETSTLRYESNPVTIALGGRRPTQPSGSVGGIDQFYSSQPGSSALHHRSGSKPDSGAGNHRHLPRRSQRGAAFVLPVEEERCCHPGRDQRHAHFEQRHIGKRRTIQRRRLQRGRIDHQPGCIPQPAQFDGRGRRSDDQQLCSRRRRCKSGASRWHCGQRAGPRNCMEVRRKFGSLLPTASFRTGAAAGYVNPVTVNVTGVKPNAKATLVMRAFNGATFENSPLRFESNPFTLALGGGILPPANLVGLIRFTEVGGPTAPSFVLSVLPTGYAPGGRFTVTLKASPSSGVSVYAVEDLPPANWSVGKVSDEGKLDSNTGKVKFGPFFDSSARNLTYEVTPPARETAEKTFAGSASADGVSTAIGGDRKIDVIKFHPADNNPGDSRISINEATAYGASWRKGASWPSGPNPIPIDYVTRAGTLWKNGEAYTIDAKVSGPPLWWVNSSGGNLRSLGLRISPSCGDPNPAVGMVAEICPHSPSASPCR